MNRISLSASSQSPVLLRWQQIIVKFGPILWGLLLIVPVLVYSLTIFRDAYNFPFEDDFNSALSFISDFAFTRISLSDRIGLLFSQYNEHRIVFDRLVFLCDYYLFGSLNFRRLTLLGNVSVLLLALLFVKLSFRAYPWHQRLFYLIPVAYSLFLFQYWELTTWAMAALSNFYVVVFTMFSLYQLSKPGKYTFLLSCVAATLATFTIENGLFCFIAGVPVLVLMKNYRRLGMWLVIALVNILFYFRNYTRPPYHPDIANTLLNHSGQAIRYFFSLIGTFFPNHPTISLLFGLVMVVTALGLFIYLWRTGRLTDNLPMLGLLLFLYLTCLSITAGRAGFGVQQAYSARYGFVAVMLYATQTVLIIENIKNYSLRTAVAVVYGTLAILLFASGTNSQHRRNIDQRSVQLRKLSIDYQANPKHVKLPWGTHNNPKQFLTMLSAKEFIVLTANEINCINLISTILLCHQKIKVR